MPSFTPGVISTQAFFTPGAIDHLAYGVENVAMAKKSNKRQEFQPTLIRLWRKHRNLTQERLAERVTLSVASISRLENGKQPYTQPVLEELANALDCEAPDLIARKPGEPNDEVQRLLERMDSVQKKQAVQILQTFTGDEEAA
tara:strand:+ start:1327 stop:1755 length:429 start_codon:yes stop_codon:yes gene_type:complete